MPVLGVGCIASCIQLRCMTPLVILQFPHHHSIGADSSFTYPFENRTIKCGGLIPMSIKLASSLCSGPEPKACAPTDFEFTMSYFLGMSLPAHATKSACFQLSIGEGKVEFAKLYCSERMLSVLCLLRACYITALYPDYYEQSPAVPSH
jgi:hypothetical protein